MEKKTIGDKVDVYGKRVIILRDLVLLAAAVVAGCYWVFNPSVVATGERHPIEMPNYGHYEQLTEEERKATPFDWNTNSMYSEANYREWWRVKVENNGKAPLTSLKLEVPVEGVYRIGDGEPTVFDKSIDLGTLTGYNEVTVKVWTLHPPLGVTPRDYRVSHTDGAEIISFPITVSSTDATLLSLSKFLLYLAACVLIPSATVSFVMKRYLQAKLPK